jgi:hypothetical protein
VGGSAASTENASMLMVPVSRSVARIARRYMSSPRLPCSRCSNPVAPTQPPSTAWVRASVGRREADEAALGGVLLSRHRRLRDDDVARGICASEEERRGAGEGRPQSASRLPDTTASA